MGNCYKMTKRINGRYYDYWQRTYRAARRRTKGIKAANPLIAQALLKKC
jgi:hypothetical protein